MLFSLHCFSLKIFLVRFRGCFRGSVLRYNFRFLGGVEGLGESRHRSMALDFGRVLKEAGSHGSSEVGASQSCLRMLVLSSHVRVGWVWVVGMFRSGIRSFGLMGSVPLLTSHSHTTYDTLV